MFPTTSACLYCNCGNHCQCWYSVCHTILKFQQELVRPTAFGISESDANQGAELANFHDALHVPEGPMTRARAKRIKEAMQGLIQQVWKDQAPTNIPATSVALSLMGAKEDCINLVQVQAFDGLD
jgi:hypothetical protein